MAGFGLVEEHAVGVAGAEMNSEMAAAAVKDGVVAEIKPWQISRVNVA